MKSWTDKAAFVAKEILGQIGMELPRAVRSNGGTDPNGGASAAAAPHLHWMLQELAKGEMSPTKACRWLGYVQAILVWTRIYTLQEMKEVNQRAGDGVAPSHLSGYQDEWTRFTDNLAFVSADRACVLALLARAEDEKRTLTVRLARGTYFPDLDP